MSKRQFVALDLLRGMAAVLVLLSHARSSIFVDFGQVDSSSWLVHAWYFFTGLSGEAVLLFFVLSGFFIAKSAFEAIKRGRWNWRWYFIQRSTRLEIVLLPALLLTFILDYAGLHYASLPGVYSPDAPARLAGASNAGQSGWTGFLGNALFLQTILVKPFGSNGALWSLANEFWYYMVFPFLLFGVLPGLNIWKRLGSFAVAALILTFTGRNIALLFVVWLAGVAAYLAYPHLARLGRLSAAWLTAFLVLLLFVFLLASRARMGVLPGGYLGSLLLACIGAPLIAVVARYTELLHPKITTVIHGLADRSYSLYAFHLPVVMVLAAAIWGTERRQSGWVAFALFLGVICIVGLVTEGLYRCFEQNTSRVRAWVWRAVGSWPDGQHTR